MLNYPVELEFDEDAVLVSFPDIPGARTFGDNRAEALANAVDALETMLAAMIDDREDIPEPSAADGRPIVSPSLLGALKVALYRAMRTRGWRKVDLARAMGLNPRQIDRLLDLRHNSTLAQLEQALAVCGRRVDVSTRDAEAAE